jgi:predicted DNA-binding transcriptional regulator AlpA
VEKGWYSWKAGLFEGLLLLAHSGREEKDCWRRTQHKRSSLCVTILDGMAKPDLVGLAEVAEMLGTSRRQAIRWTQREDFPDPILRLRATPVWEGREVRRWKREREPDKRSRAR